MTLSNEQHTSNNWCPNCPDPRCQRSYNSHLLPMDLWFIKPPFTGPPLSPMPPMAQSLVFPRRDENGDATLNPDACSGPLDNEERFTNALIHGDPFMGFNPTLDFDGIVLAPNSYLVERPARDRLTRFDRTDHLNPTLGPARVPTLSRLSALAQLPSLARIPARPQMPDRARVSARSHMQRPIPAGASFHY